MDHERQFRSQDEADKYADILQLQGISTTVSYVNDGGYWIVERLAGELRSIVEAAATENLCRNGDLLNRMLSHSCPRDVVDEVTNTYEYDLHCLTLTVTARVIGWSDKHNHAEYEIVSWSLA
jgi:hypothetical protein